MNKLFCLTLVLGALSTSSFADNKTSTLRTTASLTTICKLSANDIVFAELDLIKNKSLVVVYKSNKFLDFFN